MLRNTSWKIIVLDRLNYASHGLDRLRDISCFDENRIKIYTIDLTLPVSEGMIKEIGQVDYIVHAGAETHVDRSINEPVPFVQNNINSTLNLLEFAKTQRNLQWLVYFSTDEVHGPAPLGIDFEETDAYNCTNPYSASKAGSEQICLAYANCYNIPLFITRTMNLTGERQHSEKFIPMCIRKILNEETITIHADITKTVPGSRKYIHCRNAADAILFLLKNAEHREIYNIVGEQEINNLQLAQLIAKILNKPLKYELVSFHASRPGHDLRYSLDGSKLAKLGWKPPKTFEESLKKTIHWTLEHKQWI